MYLLSAEIPSPSEFFVPYCMAAARTNGFQVEPTWTPEVLALLLKYFLSMPGPPYRATMAPVFTSTEEAPNWTKVSVSGRFFSSISPSRVSSTALTSASTFSFLKVVWIW